MKPPIITIVGPTATGKTSLSIELAKLLSGEIISADSRQIYRGFDIGSGKVTFSEMQNIPHYMIDIRDPWEGFSVADFQQEANSHIKNIISRKLQPILVGGTGLYIDAIIRGYNIPEVKPNLALRAKLEVKSLEQLQQMYQSVCPNETMNSSDFQNPVRLIRTIEKSLSGISSISTIQQPSPYNPIVIGLIADSKTLRTNIEERVTQRLEAGAIEEVESLYQLLQQHLSPAEATKKLSSFGLGTVAILEYLDDKITLSQLTSKYITKEYQYAKRQLTWFKRATDIHWIDVKKANVTDEALRYTNQILAR